MGHFASASATEFGTRAHPSRSSLGRWKALGRLGARLAQSAVGPGVFEVEAVPYQLGLAHGALHRVRLAQGCAVQCMAGSLWITLDGEGIDHVIDAGGALGISAGTSFVAYALEPSTLRICPTPTDWPGGAGGGG